MDHPFETNQNQAPRVKGEGHRLKLRTGILIALFCCVMLVFGAQLVQIQLVDGASYLETASYTTVQTETVDSVRGELLDRYGRVLATNTASYAVKLNTSVMGERRNEILSGLLSLCREEGIEWSDSLPITVSAPWSYTRTESVFSYETKGDDGEVTVGLTSLGRLAEACKWAQDVSAEELSAEALLRAMCDTFGIELDPSAPITEEIRSLAGVLYEVYLRTNGIVTTDYVFTRNVDIAFITKTKERTLTGVTIQTDTSRQYNTDYAAHVLGVVGAQHSDEVPYYQELGYPMNAYVGRFGAELAFESYLHGSSGVRQIEADDNGKIITQNWLTQPAPGSNVVLTLDLALQTTTEDLMAEYMSSMEDPRGAAVVVDMTGGVLAMATYPTYDLSDYFTDYNQLVADEAKPLVNRATQGVYPPGSTFKMVTAIAALTEEVITTTSTVYCPGSYTWNGTTFKCWIHPGRHGTEAVTKAITDSCNVFFYQTGRDLGITKLGEYASRFGLGQPTGIELSEEKGYVAGPETSALLNREWYGGNVASAAIGQENNQFTPLQLANYVATLVNGGEHYEAHLLKAVKSSDYSETVYQYEPVLVDTIDIDPDHLNAVKLGMYNLSKTASMARYFSSLPVEVGCKTGTAEVAASDANAVFVCFAPYDDPQIAVCLVAEAGSSGGSLASVAAGIMAQYFSADSSLSDLPGENTLLR